MVETYEQQMFELEPTVGQDGFADVGGIPHGAIGTIAHELGLSHDTVNKRVKKADLASEWGRDRVGKRVKLYSLELVRTICSDVLETLLQADENNVVLKEDGTECATIKRIASFLGRDEATVKTRVALAELKGFRARDKFRRVNLFYSIEAVRTACAELLEELPTVGVNCQMHTDGTILYQGKQRATVNTLMGILRLSRRAIQARILSSKCKSLRIRDQLGRVFPTYLVENVRTACAELLNVKLEPDKDGFVLHGGRRHGHMHALAKELGVSHPYISSLIRKHDVPHVSAKDGGNRLVNFFDLEAIRSLASQKLETKDRLDSEGCVSIDGVVWISRWGAKQKLSISPNTINARLQKHPPPETRNALDSSGHVVIIYPFEYLRQICSDMMVNYAQLDELGCTRINGHEHMTGRALLKRFKVGELQLRVAIAKAGLKNQIARLHRSNRAVEVFSVEDVGRILKR